MAENAFLWSVTAADNATADPAVPWPENMVPGAVNNAARSTMSGIARLIKDLNGSITTAGSANAYTVTSNSGHSTYTNGTLITAKASFTNTAAATLNLNTYGAKNIRVFSSSGEVAVAASQIQSGGTYQFRYDSAADSASGGFILLNPSPDPSITARVGEIKIWATDTAPTGWLFANGAAVSRTTYSSLFALFSTYYGNGDGSTTFNLPDFRNRAPFGGDMGNGTAGLITSAGSSIDGHTLGSSGGVETVTLTTAQIASHTHTASSSSVSASGTTSGASVGHTHSVSGTTGNESVGHTHSVSGTSSGASVGHTHAVNGNTGTESVNHTHSGTTAGASAGHTHSGTTGTESADHTHSYNTATGKTGTATGFGTLTGTIWNGADTAATSGGKSATHTHTITTGDVSADHTHTITTGNASAAHSHAVSLTSGDHSVDHTHTVSLTSGDVSADHTHTFSATSGAVSADHTHTVTVTGTAVAQSISSTGGGTAHTNMPPAIIINFIVKF